MSTDEFQEIWKAYDIKLERSLRLNEQLLREVQSQKAQSVLRSLVVVRGLGIGIGIIYLILLVVIFCFVWSQPVMAVSFGVFIVVTLIAIITYIREVAIIHELGYADNVLDTQEKLAAIQSSIIWSVRISWLQLPFWGTFFVSNQLLREGGRQFLVVEVPLVAVMIGAAIFLYRNVTLENMRKKKWVQALIKGTGMQRVVKAMEFMGEIENFKKE